MYVINIILLTLYNYFYRYYVPVGTNRKAYIFWSCNKMRCVVLLNKTL